MPFSSSNTGSTDLRETEVQQPNTAAHLSTDSRPRAFSANSGQFDAGSTTTASSLRPSTPPLAFCCSISISMTSFSVVSLIAMVPESECRMPTLMGPVSWARAAVVSAFAPPRVASVAAAAAVLPKRRRVSIRSADGMRSVPQLRVFAARRRCPGAKGIAATAVPHCVARFWRASADYLGRPTKFDRQLVSSRWNGGREGSWEGRRGSRATGLAEDAGLRSDAAQPHPGATPMIHVLAIITAKPGMRDAILKEFRANMPAVHAENGCIEYGPAIDAGHSPTKY